MNIDDIKAATCSVLQRHADVLVCAYIFGSVARDEASTRSDVDLALLYRGTPPATLEGLGIDVADELNEALKRQVDVVVLNRASPDLVHRVLRDGILLVENDRSARVRFEVKSRNDYFDVLPYLREYRRYAREHNGRR